MTDDTAIIIKIVAVNIAVLRTAEVRAINFSSPDTMPTSATYNTIKAPDYVGVTTPKTIPATIIKGAINAGIA